MFLEKELITMVILHSQQLPLVSACIAFPLQKVRNMKIDRIWFVFVRRCAAIRWKGFYVHCEVQDMMHEEW